MIIIIFSIISFTQDIKTNKPQLKTQRKTRLNSQLSQTLTIKADDIKMLNIFNMFNLLNIEYIYSLVKGAFPEINNLAKCKQISNFQKKKHFGKNEKKNIIFIS